MYSRFMSLSKVLSNSPDAIAIIKGSKEYKTIIGTVYLYDTDMGVIVVTEVSGLSTSNEKCSDKFFAFHIHGGEDCSGTMEDHFQMRCHIMILITALIRIMQEIFRHY